jgi:hypothetical protein
MNVTKVYGKNILGIIMHLGTTSSEPTKELDVMNCTKEQQAKITPYLVKALGEYQEKHSVPGEKTQGPWLSKFSPIRFNRYQCWHYDERTL